MAAIFDSDAEFAKGVEALEDLAQLGPYTNAPILGRAFHHFSKAKMQLEEQIYSTIFSPAFQKFLPQGLGHLLKDQIGSPLHLASPEISFAQWNKILTVLPILVKIAKCLPWPQVEQTTITGDLITMHGHLPAQESTLLRKRSTIYQYFRQLLAQQTLLTFSVETLVDQSAKLTLQLDLRHQEQVVYQVPVGDGICFSSIFPYYIVQDWPAVAAQGAHYCLNIKADGNIEELTAIPEQFMKNSPEAVLLHFRFLFRPVSLIIPGKGEIISAQTRDTGREIYATNSSLTASSSYVDIFSLLAN